MLISVCICTFRRPQLLASLLSALGQQQFGAYITRIELVVVDNDPEHSARPVLTAWQAPPALSLVFMHAPEPNISVARNLAVHAASSDLIAFIDDDETPATDWLLRLLETLHRLQVDAVFGPVIPVYPAQVSAWIRKGGFFNRARLATGTPIDLRHARTGNVLLKAACLQTLAGPFDIAFGRTGGEDSLLFRDLLARQCSFVWCDEAPVFEVVTMERANAAWLLRRAFRIGQTWIRAELYRLPLKRAVARGGVLCAKAGLQLIVSLGLALLWLPVSRVKAFDWMRTAVTQAGKLTGMSRFQYREYGS